MASSAGPTADATAPPQPPALPLWRRLTRWRQTSQAEGFAAEAGVCALSG